MALVAAVVPVSLLTVGIAAGPAGAAGGKVECNAASGNAQETVTLSDCVGGNTGGSSVAVPASDLTVGGTIAWVSGSTTTTSIAAATLVSAKKCPGYVKPTPGSSPVEPSAVSWVSTISADTGNGMTLPGTMTGSLCVSPSEDLTILKPFVFSWTPSSVTCTAAVGNLSSAITLGGCSGGYTYGYSERVPAAILTAGGTIAWLSGGSTTIGVPTVSSRTGSHCPGYVKPVRGQTPPPEPVAESFTAPVTADSGDGLALPGKVKGAVCIAADGSVTATKPWTFK
ncbi:MAG TPA: hypothetical protein VHW93_01460 [Acidimicrobiales bacterium]|nr:hypothetical protein [Acidimicrobiales bacterium]